MFTRPKKQHLDEVNKRIKKIHSAIADKLLSQPELFSVAERTLEQRFETKMMRYGSYLLWKGILEAHKEPEVFRALLLADDERTTSLRRETIFTGILSEEEREEIN